MKTNLLCVFTLWQREIVRFLRQKSRVVGAVVPPFLFWILIGSGVGTSFQGGGTSSAMNYKTYFFPGTLLLIVVFTSIFSSISLIQDRQEGFLQSVLVAPVSRMSLALGKILGGTSLALIEAAAFLAVATLLGTPLRAAVLGQTLLILAVISFGVTAVGFFFAWQMDSIQGFHAVMNLMLMPAWLLSGSLFPAHGAPVWLSILMRLDPLHYALASLCQSLGDPWNASAPLSAPLAVVVTLGFSAAAFLACALVASRRTIKG